MMFIVRSAGERPEATGLAVKLHRKTPPQVHDGSGHTDFFCLGDTAAIDELRATGWNVVELHDGFYADDLGGGVAIWGQGRYWEIRDTHFTVKEAAGPAGAAEAGASGGEQAEVRRAIFGA